MYKAPSTFRTPRKIAEQTTDASHFEEGPKFVNNHGLPVSKDLGISAQEYKERALKGDISTSSHGETGSDTKAPFTTKK